MDWSRELVVEHHDLVLEDLVEYRLGYEVLELEDVVLDLPPLLLLLGDEEILHQAVALLGNLHSLELVPLEISTSHPYFQYAIELHHALLEYSIQVLMFLGWLSLQGEQACHSARPHGVEYLVQAVVDCVVVEVLLLHQLLIAGYLELPNQIAGQHGLDLGRLVFFVVLALIEVVPEPF